MVFVGIFLISTKYHVPRWGDIFKGMILLTILSLVAIPVNYALSAYSGWSVIITRCCKSSWSVGLRSIFTLLIFVIYVLITVIIVSIIRLVCNFSVKKVS